MIDVLINFSDEADKRRLYNALTGLQTTHRVLITPRNQTMHLFFHYNRMCKKLGEALGYYPHEADQAIREEFFTVELPAENGKIKKHVLTSVSFIPPEQMPIFLEMIYAWAAQEFEVILPSLFDS